MRKHSRVGWVLLIMGAFMIILGGCAAAPKALDKTSSKPQVVVNPDKISLGVAKLMGTKIIFQASGFKPGDNVLISLLGPQDTNIAAALAKVEPDGTFRAEVGETDSARLTKLAMLRADTMRNEKFETVLVISRPTIPPGIYTVKAASMIADISAETKMTINKPSVKDSFMDWLGKITGKIVYKPAQP